LTKLSLKTTKAKPLSYIKKEPSLWQESDATITVLVPELNAPFILCLILDISELNQRLFMVAFLLFG
jgi:hypothetical protein